MSQATWNSRYVTNVQTKDSRRKNEANKRLDPLTQPLIRGPLPTSTVLVAPRVRNSHDRCPFVFKLELGATWKLFGSELITS